MERNRLRYRVRVRRPPPRPAGRRHAQIAHRGRSRRVSFISLAIADDDADASAVSAPASGRRRRRRRTDHHHHPLDRRPGLSVLPAAGRHRGPPAAHFRVFSSSVFECCCTAEQAGEEHAFHHVSSAWQAEPTGTRLLAFVEGRFSSPCASGTQQPRHPMMVLHIPGYSRCRRSSIWAVLCSEIAAAAAGALQARQLSAMRWVALHRARRPAGRTRRAD